MPLIDIRRLAVGLALLAPCTWLGVPRTAQAAETCVARSIDQVGKCSAKRGSRVQQIIDRELRGLEPPATKVAAPFNADLLATQIAGGYAKGEAWPVDVKRGEWVLASNPARLDADARLELRSDITVTTLALLHWQAAHQPVGDAPPVRPQVQLLAAGEVQGMLAGQASAEKTATNLPQCIDPDGHEGNDFRLSGSFRWLMLGKQRVLAATVNRSEGYAGGGGHFTSSMLFAIRGDQVVPVACFSQENYQMFGGNWNPDGTREHPEARAAWRMKTRARASSAWPDLLLQPLTRDTPGATLVWDDQRALYVLAPAPVRVPHAATGTHKRK